MHLRRILALRVNHLPAVHVLLRRRVLELGVLLGPLLALAPVVKEIAELVALVLGRVEVGSRVISAHVVLHFEVEPWSLILLLDQPLLAHWVRVSTWIQRLR